MISKIKYYCENNVYAFGEKLSTIGWMNSSIEEHSMFNDSGPLNEMNKEFIHSLFKKEEIIQNINNNCSYEIKKPYNISKVCSGFASIVLLTNLGECAILSNPEYPEFAQLNVDYMNKHFNFEDVSCGYRHCIFVASRKKLEENNKVTNLKGSFVSRSKINRLFKKINEFSNCINIKKKSNQIIQKKEIVLIATGRNIYYQCGYQTKPIQNTNFFEIILPEYQIMGKLVKVVCGYYHSLFLMDDNSIWSAGRPILPSYEEHQKRGYLKFQIFNGDKVVPISTIAAGNVHNIAVSENGLVYTWGKNNCGQLGLDSNKAEVPTLVTHLKNHHIIAASAGYTHSVFLSKTGRVFTCGDCTYGKIGRKYESKIPTEVILNDIASSISAGGNHTLIGMKNGSVYALGHNGFGQCGNLGAKFYDNLSCVEIPNSEYIIEISAGGFHSVLLQKETVYSRGVKNFFSNLEKSFNYYCDLEIVTIN